MKTRIITGAVMAAVGIPLLWFSEYFIYPFVVSLCAFGAMLELLRALGVHDRYLLSVPAYAIALLLPFGAYIWIKLTANPVKDYLLFAALCFVVYLLYLMFVAVLAQGEITFSSVASTFGAAFYISCAFLSLVVLRYLSHGLACLILVFICAWVCDMAAYFVGSMLGKHKLVERLSPKKTVEGSIGGIVVTALVCVLYGVILTHAFSMTASYLLLAVCGVLLSVVSQIGDLFASLIKRERGIKDYGRIFPGHGGILDRFDSIVAVAPVLMTVCLIAPPIL